MLKAQVVEGLVTKYRTNINIDIDEGATLHVPKTIAVDGTQLLVKGRITFKNLIVERNGKVVLSKTSATASYTQGHYPLTVTAGTYLLSSIVLKYGSLFEFSAGLTLTVQTMILKRYVKVKADFMIITADLLDMERAAELSVAGKATGSSIGDGHGKEGGSYASSGGFGTGTAFGTLYKPILPGSRGGEGGTGGSYLYIDVGVFYLDGRLNADGSASDTGGGGSGGSIYVQCRQTLHGLGTFTATGGDTTSPQGGAGSGGRIAVYMGKNLFYGKMHASGGMGKAAKRSGGPGSIYIQQGSFADHNLQENLIVDNAVGQETYYLTLDEGSRLDLQLSHVTMYNYAKLQLVNDEKNRTLKVDSIEGDGTGLLRLQRNQKGTLERVSSTDYVSSKLRINLELNDGGEFILSETTFIMGKFPVALSLDGILRGVVNMYVAEDRKVTIGSHARIVPFVETLLSSQSDVTFSLLQLNPGSEIIFDPNVGANMVIGSLHVKFRAHITADYFNISCADMSIEVAAKLSSSAADRNDSTTLDHVRLTVKGGAGHGGIGGEAKGVTDSNGRTYGSAYYPTEPGSRSTVSGGRGGGYLYIVAGGTIINDGEMSVDGEDNATAGGSGGSIYVRSLTTEGIGAFSVVGGDGDDESGAGGGGRMAIYCVRMSRFEGRYLSHGGTVANRPYQCGGGGTVYLEETRNWQPYKQLRIFNDYHPWDLYTEIENTITSDYEFDELHITGQAYLHLPGEAEVRLVVHKIIGDGTGLLHARNQTNVTLEYQSNKRTAFTAAVTLKVDEDGEIRFPSTLYIYGDGVTMRNDTLSSLHLLGRITGVSHLLVTEGKSLYIGPAAHTASMLQDTYTDIQSPGVFSMGQLDLKSKALLETALDTALICSSGRVDVRYLARIKAENITLSVGKLNVEAGGLLTVAASDRPEDTIDSTHGKGQSGNTPSGGGHACNGGYGGTVAGGGYYGSLYYPQERGSRGGSRGSNSPGGNGGGLIQLNIGVSLFIDGTLKANGGDGRSGGAGGSAGSIRVTAAAFEGHGSLHAVGGAGSAGGSAGRISVNIRGWNHFHGRHVATGGKGADINSHGGPGSVYLRDIRYMREHTQLLLDGGGATWDLYYTLDEPSMENYTFDELHLTNKASLQMKSGDDVSRSLTAVKIYGDKTGRIHLHANHIGFLEKAATLQTTMKTPANIWIDEGAKAYMATLVYILARGEIALKVCSYPLRLLIIVY